MGSAAPPMGLPSATRSSEELAARADNTEIVMQWSPWVVCDLLSASEILEVLESQPPTDRTVALAVRLGGQVLDELDASRLLTVWTRIDSWVTAQMDKAIVAVTGVAPGNSFDPGREEAALAMRVASRTAASRVMDARERRGRLRSVGDALERGVLLTRQSQDMVDALEWVTTDVADEVCALVLPKAGFQTRAELGRSVRKALLSVDPDTDAQQHETAKAERSVRIYPQPHGMATLVASFSAVDAETVFRALDAQARFDIASIEPGGLRPPIDHARTDCLVSWAQTALADPGLPRSHGRIVDIRITATLPAIRGESEDPAYLDGYGPIHPNIARELLPEGRLRRLVTDPVDGRLLDFGRTTYRPPAALADFVIARDPLCIIRGCSRPAERCELDHRIPFNKGATSADNLAPLCKRHHDLKTSGDWQLTKTSWGELVWITPTGRRYTLDAHSADPSIEPPATEEYWPDFESLRATAHAGANKDATVGTGAGPVPERECPF